MVMECWLTSCDFSRGGSDSSWIVAMRSSVATFCADFCRSDADNTCGSPAEGVSTGWLLERSIWMPLVPSSLILFIYASDWMRKWFFKKGCSSQARGRITYMPIFNSAGVTDWRPGFFIFKKLSVSAVSGSYTGGEQFAPRPSHDSLSVSCSSRKRQH